MWNDRQRACLAALGIPVYEANRQVVNSPESLPEPAQTHAESFETALENAVLYRLGPWVLRFPEPLPVTSFTWLRDLAVFVESRPTQINDAGTTPIIDCSHVAKEQLAPEEKRMLWQQLKPALNT
ncbi:MAG: hypothetical protein JJU10_01980 [Idiomarina sp.]|nr:hypothetical protein [Idiomarina sp.]